MSGETRVDLHGEEPSHARREAFGERAEACADLDDRLIALKVAGADDPVEDGAVLEEVLPERLVRGLAGLVQGTGGSRALRLEGRSGHDLRLRREDVNVDPAGVPADLDAVRVTEVEHVA